MIEAVLEGMVADQYRGGIAGRTQEIEAGASRSASALYSDLLTAATHLRDTWSELPDSAWDMATRPLHGPRPVRHGVRARWREVEVHHVDLDIGYGPDDWPTEFVETFLTRMILGLPARARDVPDGARWLLTDTTSGERWLVSAGAVQQGPGLAAHHVRGPSWALLAWLFGRVDGRAMRIMRAEHDHHALALPEYFPFA
jgi:maleylpyruvate isomerase